MTSRAFVRARIDERLKDEAAAVRGSMTDRFLE
jgi:antitoxin component of RelBE/YafQ-DinJ toxin-antitoxin module